MAALLNLGRRRLLLLPNPLRSSYRSAAAAAAADDDDEQKHHEPRKAAGRWLTLPRFTPQINASAVGRNITGGGAGPDEAAPVTALKWVRRCCPELPEKLVQKLFRLRQVRKEQTSPSVCAETQAVKRVSAKDALVSGDVILLPITVQRPASEKSNCSSNEDEISFVRGLELYKDPAIIVLNKPPGMPVQGGVGIKYSVDVLAASSLRYDLPESPRLVHRLDQESSGVLVLGRTQTSATILHSIFREKTSEALSDNARRALQRKYWALVIGTPKSPKGLISAPLAKIVVEDGKSERVTIARNMDSTSSQHALTEYKVIKSSSQGYTWLELCPLTGRKHQLRVHCAEILGTPIVGDYKYGWQAHRRWNPVPCHMPVGERGKMNKQNLPFGLDFQGGSISEKQPRLHLHCRQMVMPNISLALQHLESSSSTPDLSDLRKIHFLAPLPLHMQTSWGLLGY